MPFYIGPLRRKDTVHHAVSNGSIATGLMMPDHAVLVRADGCNCPLGPEVEVVATESHDLAAQLLEGVCEE